MDTLKCDEAEMGSRKRKMDFKYQSSVQHPLQFCFKTTVEFILQLYWFPGRLQSLLKYRICLLRNSKFKVIL